MYDFHCSFCRGRKAPWWVVEATGPHSWGVSPLCTRCLSNLPPGNFAGVFGDLAEAVATAVARSYDKEEALSAINASLPASLVFASVPPFPPRGLSTQL